jgi:choline dehydrogenase-like flavoprotein
MFLPQDARRASYAAATLRSQCFLDMTSRARPGRNLPAATRTPASRGPPLRPCRRQPGSRLGAAGPVTGDLYPQGRRADRARARRPDELIPVQRAFFEVCRRLGFPQVTDLNHPQATGVGPFPQDRRGRLRLSTAIGYLLPARHRPNLTIRPHCLGNRVLVAGDRAVGVDIAGEGEPAQVRGRRRPKVRCW